MQAEHLKPLTALRFFAAFWVVMFLYWPRLAVDFTPTLVAKGYLGVELFFTLSGFILCHVYLPAAEAGRFKYGSFLWARLARIYPLHLATLAAIGALAGAALTIGRSIDPNILSMPSLAPNLLLLHAWGLAPTSGWNHPSWSISAEWFAYLSFPAFAFAAIRLRRRPQVAVLAALALLFGLNTIFLALAGFPLTQATFAWGALRIVPCFALGCALYLLWRSGVVQRRMTAALGASFSGAALLLGAQFGVPDPLLVAACGGLVYFLAALSSSGSKAVSHPVLVYLGEISYSIYMTCVLWELVFVNALTTLFPTPDEKLPIWLWLIFVAMVVPLAAVSHHLIERPARGWLRQWSERPNKRDLRITPA